MTLPEANPATFTLRRVQAMLGLTRSVLDGLIAQGFVTPLRGKRNEHRFTFRDLMLLRTAQALQAAKIPPRKILRSLAKLKTSLPQDLPLTGLRITAIGGDVVVQERDAQWQVETGQLLMDFEVAPVGAEVAFLEHGAAPANPLIPVEDDDSARWLARGEALEDVDPIGAERAFQKAIALAPALTEAYLNLGAIWCEAGRFSDVLELSRQALVHCPASALVYFNHAVALDNLEQLEPAVAAYEQSLKLDPMLADAHYNLARLQEQLGDARGALRHFSAYRRLQR